MAKAGDTIENPLSGERITFLEVPSETNGDLLRFDWHIPPGFFIPEHVHVRQEERHEILSGTLRGRVAGRERDFGRGETVIGPAEVPHAWRNPSDGEELRMVSELQPALGFEALLENGFTIARDLKTDKLGAPKHLLRLSILLDEAGGEFYPTGVPMPVWRALSTLIAALARVGRLLGYEARSPGRRASAGPAGVSRGRGEGALTLVSALWLLNAAAGAVVAIREDLPGEFAGMTRWHDPPADFFRGAGTALSPGLPMMALQAALTVLGTRGGKAGTVGAAGMAALGAGATVGVLGEPITYRVLSPSTFDPLKAAIVSAAVVLSPLMTLLAARRLFAPGAGR